jgi:hypothetical protein
VLVFGIVVFAGARKYADVGTWAVEALERTVEWEGEKYSNTPVRGSVNEL